MQAVSYRSIACTDHLDTCGCLWPPTIHEVRPTTSVYYNTVLKYHIIVGFYIEFYRILYFSTVKEGEIFRVVPLHVCPDNSSSSILGNNQLLHEQ